eukprot:181563-Hanusia_phi.AAC.1
MALSSCSKPIICLTLLSWAVCSAVHSTNILAESKTSAWAKPKVGTVAAYPPRHLYGIKPRMRLRGGFGDEQTCIKSCQMAWDVFTDISRSYNKSFNCSHMAEKFNRDPSDTLVTGGDTPMTVFRNVQNGIGVEIIHGEDFYMCIGFFRFLTSEIFSIITDTVHSQNFSYDCPGHVAFINGHVTGDFFMAPDLYNVMRADPGKRTFSDERMVTEGWEAATSNETGWQKSILHHEGGNWTVLALNSSIVVKHTQTGDAKLVLLKDGFIYLGDKDPYGLFKKPPAAVCVFNTSKHMIKTREEGEKLLSGLICEEELRIILPNSKLLQ